MQHAVSLSIIEMTGLSIITINLLVPDTNKCIIHSRFVSYLRRPSPPFYFVLLIDSERVATIPMWYSTVFRNHSPSMPSLLVARSM